MEASKTVPEDKAEAIPELQPGDHLTRPEFERRYRAMPGLKKAELIEGVVYMPSPVRESAHASPHVDLSGWLYLYRVATPGVRAGDNGTVRLDLHNEPQPDLYLRILEEYGGQSKTVEDYVDGAPDLVAEIAASSASYDLHTKLGAYERNGVREYLVWRVTDEAVDWFVLEDGRFVPLVADAGGILKSRVFPGLWLDAVALLEGNAPKVVEVLQAGLKSPEHEAFVSGLEEAGSESTNN